MRTMTFHRFDRTQPPVYGVRLDQIELGWIEATTPASYPGRSKASYQAFPRTADNGAMSTPRPLGIFGSREAAGLAILAHLRRFQFGRKLLGEEEEPWTD